MLFWWGIFLSCTQSFSSYSSAYITIISPLFITFLLFYVSGITILEQNSNQKYHSKQKYLDYRASTSILIPLPNTFYRSLPHIVKS